MQNQNDIVHMITIFISLLLLLIANYP